MGMAAVMDEFERIEYVRKRKAQAMLIGVVSGFVVALGVFFTVAFLLPDRQFQAPWIGLLTGGLIAGALRLALGPKEREFDAVEKEAAGRVDAHAASEWRGALAEGATAPSTNTIDDDDAVVAEARAAYRRATRDLWIARVVAALAGFGVSAALTALLWESDARDAIRSLIAVVAGGTITALFVFQRMRGETDDAAPASEASDGEREFFERELGEAQMMKLRFATDLVSAVLARIMVLPRSRACTVLHGDVQVGAVVETGSWLSRLSRSSPTLTIQSAIGQPMIRATKSGGEWVLRDASGVLGTIRARAFSALEARPQGGEPFRIARPLRRFVPFMDGAIRILRDGEVGRVDPLGRSDDGRSDDGRSGNGPLDGESLQLTTPPDAGYRERALLLVAAVLAS